MKIRINQSEKFDEDEVIINTPIITRKIEALLSYLRVLTIDIKGEKNGEIYILDIDDIYYFETVDNKTFAYLASEMYEVDFKLYQLNDMLNKTSFIQISKSIILNIDYLVKIATLPNMRMVAKLKNNEKIIVSRTYINGIKDKLNI